MDRLIVQARERHQGLSEEKKNKRRQYGREQYKNPSEDEKERLVEYRKTIKNAEKGWLIFANIKNSRVVFNKYLKWSALNFLWKYKKYFVWKIVFSVIIRRIHFSLLGIYIHINFLCNNFIFHIYDMIIKLTIIQLIKLNQVF